MSYHEALRSMGAPPSGGYSQPMDRVWLFLDPGNGEPHLYPLAAAMVLEKAYTKGHRGRVSLGGHGLGPFYEELHVDFGDNGQIFQESKEGGRQDVKRVEIAQGEREIQLHVARYKDSRWRIVDAPMPGKSSLRIIRLAGFLETFRYPQPEHLQQRKERLAKQDEEGLVGLWEWCLLPEIGSWETISDKNWALYSPEENGIIEKAFQAGEPKASILVGTVEYDIMFEADLAGGRQVNWCHRKRRFVRRREVKPAKAGNMESIFSFLAPQPAAVPKEFFSTRKNSYTLQSKGSQSLSGSYTYDVGSGVLTADSSSEEIGKFSCDPIAAEALHIPSDPNQDIASIGIAESEIMAEIQKSSSDGAYFVLPSQLNGAEYPDYQTVVTRIQDYMYDNTGGPRGQLAVHPAAGQFIIDNAASDKNESGINAIDEILQAAKAFKLVNGYLRMPMPQDEKESSDYLSSFEGSLHTLRPLVMANVQACGLTPDKGGFSDLKHKVNLVYASAVPVDTYLNQSRTEEQKDLHVKVAEAVLVAQYYGALKTAAKSSAAEIKVFLMPLGGGVFNNPWESIAKSMSAAVEMLSKTERDKLDIQVLTWNGNPQEKRDMEKLLTQHNKLKGA